MQSPLSKPKLDKRTGWRCRVLVGVLWALGVTGLADQASGSRVAWQVQVTFELRDYQHKQRYRDPEVTKISRRIQETLLASLNRRFRHLRFTQAPSPHVLECVFNTGANIDAPAQTDPPRVDAVSFHFRLRGPRIDSTVLHSWVYLPACDASTAIPDVDTFLASVGRYLGAAEGASGAGVGTGTAGLPDPDGRYAGLFDGVLSQLPVFTDRDVVHVAQSRWLVIKVPRAEYRCSLPDLSEFKLRLDLPDPLGAQTYWFLAQLVDADAIVRDQPGVIPTDLCRGVVTRAIAPLDQTPPERLEQLTNAVASVDKTVYLLHPVIGNQPCLETSPLNFSPRPQE